MMAARYQFSLASHADDAALRQRMAEDHMKGNIALSFRREPNYFLGCALQGDRSEILKCVDANTGRIVGLGARHTTTLYVNGLANRAGYLSDLRADAEVRRGTLLARGYSFLRKLHDADHVPFYFSVILEGNTEALSALTTARAGLPIYKYRGRILTPAIHIDRQLPEISTPGIVVRRGTDSMILKIFEFLAQEHAAKQLAPCYSHRDLGTARMHDLQPADFYIAFRGEEIVGCVAAWDQSGFRQTHVERYSIPLRIARPLYNIAAKFSALHALPAAGGELQYLYLALVATENNRTDIFATLLRAVYRDRRRSSYQFMFAGLHEDDPLCEVLEDYRRIDAGGRLYVIYYPEDAGTIADMDDRTPYVEMATV